VFRLGDGVDRIADSGGAGENGILLGEGIDPSMLSMDFDTLTLKVGEGGDAIQLGTTESGESGIGAIDYLQFADGASLPFQDFLGQAFALTSDVDEPGDGGSTGDPVDGGTSGGGDDEPAGAGNPGIPGTSNGIPIALDNPATDPILAWWPDQNEVGGKTPDDGTSNNVLSLGDSGYIVSQSQAGSSLPAFVPYKQSDRLDAGGLRLRDDLSELLDAYFDGKPRFDFEMPQGKAGRTGLPNPTLTPAEVAQRWEQIERYMKTLAENDDEDARGGAFEHRIFDNWNFMASSNSAGGFGFSGSTGATRGMANMKTLTGLSEGFTRLTA
jgi:hypothetical protein